MKRCRTNLSAAVLGLSLAGICLAQPTYTYAVIPTPDGTQGFRAWVGTDGIVRGGSGTVDAGQGVQLRQCYTYKDGTWTVVPTPSTNCYFDNANKNGDFTGTLMFPGDQASHFFVYHNGGFQLLDSLIPRTLAGPTWVGPTAMNDQGDIAGWIEIQEQKLMPPPAFAPPGAGPFYTGTIESYGFVYSGGQIRELPKLSNSPALTGLSTLGPFDFVYGANSKGDYVGYALLHEAATKDDPFVEHAVLWNHDGGVVDLGTVGGTWSEANAINASGQIVGKSSVSDGEYDPTRHNIYHAFFYDNGTMTALPVPATYSIATGINDQAEVVGYYYTAKDDGNVDFSVQHPFYWHRDGTVMDLQTLVTSLPAGTVLTGVDRITNNGQIVVEAGQASAPGVTTMQLMLTPVHVDPQSNTSARRHR